MPNYSFQVLSPFDFEMLSKDIVETKYNENFECFTIGRDGGTDLRCFNNKKRIIVQCKHYEKSGFQKLKSCLKKERETVKNLNPTKYIIVTSLGLTPKNKDELLELFSDFPIESEDIIGGTEINSILSAFPEIEKKHLKLWLNSTSILERVLHNDIHNRSSNTKKLIEKKLSLWVKNKYFEKAMDILQKKSICIISGIPGIGKTTMAEMLCYSFCANNYEFYSISNLNDFFKVYDSNKKQVFYYDDFLGATQFEEKEEFKDFKTIVNILNGKTKFILTTREYIFQQGLEQSELLSNLNMKSTILKISDYSDFDKASILYNHLHFSNIPMDFCSYIVDNRRYLNIINHKNYSPRLIEWMTTSNVNFTDNTPQTYYESFMFSLNNPAKIWDKAFMHHISKESRYILYSLYFLGSSVFADDLKKISFSWIKIFEPNLTISDYNDIFETSLKELENSFIRIDIEEKKGHSYIYFHNPSIIDYISNKIKNNSDLVKEYNSLKMYFWNQKERAFDFLSEDEIRNNLKFLINNIEMPASRFFENNYKYSEGSKYKFLEDIISNHNFEDLKDSLYKSILNTFMNLNFNDNDITKLLLWIPTEYFNNEVKSKLAILFNKTDCSYEMEYFIKINKFVNFISDSECEIKIIKNIKNDEDLFYESNSSSDNLYWLHDSLQGIEPYTDYDVSDLLRKIEDKIAELESKTPDWSDYDFLESFGNRKEDNIDLLFKSLKK